METNSGHKGSEDVRNCFQQFISGNSRQFTKKVWFVWTYSELERLYNLKSKRSFLPRIEMFAIGDQSITANKFLHLPLYQVLFTEVQRFHIFQDSSSLSTRISFSLKFFYLERRDIESSSSTSGRDDVRTLELKVNWVLNISKYKIFQNHEK